MGSIETRAVRIFGTSLTAAYPQMAQFDRMSNIRKVFVWLIVRLVEAGNQHANCVLGAKQRRPWKKSLENQLTAGRASATGVPSSLPSLGSLRRCGAATSRMRWVVPVGMHCGKRQTRQVWALVSPSFGKLVLTSRTVLAPGDSCAESVSLGTGLRR